MRVLIISHMYPNTVSPLKGVFVQKQAEALAGLGIEITVVSPVPWAPGILKYIGRWQQYQQIPDVDRKGLFPVYYPRVISLPRNLLFEYYGWTYERGMRKVLEDQLAKGKGFDLIHAHVAHPDGAAAVRFGQRYGIPVVVTIHGQDFAHTLNRSNRAAQSVKNTLQLAKRVILVSQKLRDRYGLVNWADDLSKYRVIYNGVELDQIIAENNSVMKRKPEKRRILLSVGFLRPPKGHAYVIKALKALVPRYPDLLYRIVGEGSERRGLEELTKELGLENHVEFLGSLPHGQAIQQMRECDIFVMPSWNEAFGVVYLEALAQGKPIIGTEGEGIAEILETEDVGFAVPPQDSGAIVRALEFLLENDEIARAKGQRGRQLVQEKFTWEYNARQMLQIYQEILEP